jgi:Ran GTPase-activating protein (RanGAP) involved in mRNA processing and transport
VQAAPQLSLLECDLDVRSAHKALPLLNGDVTIAAVRAEFVLVNFDGADDGGGDTAALLAALSSHDTLKRLSVSSVTLDAAELDALVDVAFSRRLTSLDVYVCSLSPDSLPALSRLLRGGSLRELELISNPLFEEGVSAEFCAALRDARFSFLDLNGSRLFDFTECGIAVLEALTGHPTLRLLDLSCNRPTSPEAKLAVGEALRRLISADSSLEEIDVQHCGLGDDALRPLFAIVAQSTRLRTLDCCDNNISPEFARTVVLPAVRSNSSLRKLSIAGRNRGIAELEEAEALVNARGHRM